MPFTAFTYGGPSTVPFYVSGLTSPRVTNGLVIGSGVLNLASLEMKDGTVGVAYTDTVAAFGGTAPYTYAVTSGVLPAGLSLNSSTGAVTGTPTTAGSSSFDITATDAHGATCFLGFTIVVSSAASSGGGAYAFVA